MLKFICIPVIIALATLQYSQVLGGNNSGQAFSIWPDTGQTTCYDNYSILVVCPAPGLPFNGQDAQYNGPKRSYTRLDINGNALPESAFSWAMVRDNVTGLIWEAKEANDSSPDFTNPHDADNAYTWCDTNPDTNGEEPGACGDNDTQDFLAALNSGPGFGGHTDWRLPTIKELVTLIDRSTYYPYPAIDPTYFPLTVRSLYWSATTVGIDPGSAWVDDGDGVQWGRSKWLSWHVRAVRGGQIPPGTRFLDNEDGTVTDTATCLQWQQATADVNNNGISDTSDIINWENALAYAENLALAGHDDWRLPDINELNSIVDYSKLSPLIDPTVFPGTQPDYWSSSTHQNALGWVGRFIRDYDGDYYKTKSLYMRSVRGMQCGYWAVTASAGENGNLDPGTPTPQTVAEGSTVQFTFNANTRYHVAGVSGCGVSYNNTSNEVTTYTATTGAITDDCTVFATFAINQYIVSAYAGANGSLDAGTPSPQTVADGSTAQFTFHAEIGYHVAGVTSCGVSYSNTSNAVTSYTAITGAITGDCTVSATFAINRHTVNSSVSGGNGTIAPVGTQTVNYGAPPSFTLTPATGYHIANVLGTCGGTLVGNIFTTVPVTANCTVVAGFTINTFTVTASVGANGSLDPGTLSPQTVADGSTAQFTFNADRGYHVAGVTGCGVSYSNTRNAVTSYTAITGAITGDCTVSSTFAVNQYTISSSTGANGMISPLGAVGVNQGSSQGFIVTPDINYKVADVMVDGSSVGAVVFYQFINVTTNHFISASFAIDTHLVSVTIVGRGEGSVTVSPGGIDCPGICSAEYDHATPVTLTVVPGEGSTFAGWSGDYTGSEATCYITVDRALNVTARFNDSFSWQMFLPIIINKAQPLTPKNSR